MNYHNVYNLFFTIKKYDFGCNFMANLSFPLPSPYFFKEYKS